MKKKKQKLPRLSVKKNDSSVTSIKAAKNKLLDKI